MRSLAVWLAMVGLVGVAVSCQRSEAPPMATTGGMGSDSAKGQGGSSSPSAQPVTPVASGDAALATFEKRIVPILKSPKPSSCSECHLSGVDLKDYVGPSQEQTFASLVKAGLVDVTRPDDSKILTFIARRPEKPNLITDQVREEELNAFRAWIRAAVQDPGLLAAKPGDALGSPLPVEVIRHARRDRVLASFIENVWSEVGRCAACHSPDRNQKQVKENGPQVSWIQLRDPAGTLKHLVDSGLIDTDEPDQSLILQKPTLQVKHGGGQKMVIGDRSYKQVRRFLDDYAATVNAKYRTADELPTPNPEVSQTTEIWLKLTDVPARFDKLLLQVDLYRKTESGWSEYRVASSDRLAFGPQKLWQHSLSLTAPRDSGWAKEIRTENLPPGRYLAKIYVDQKGKLQQDYRAKLDEEDFVGQVEIDSRWPAGYGQMTVAAFPFR